jgi:hypothetical protein
MELFDQPAFASACCNRLEQSPQWGFAEGSPDGEHLNDPSGGAADRLKRTGLQQVNVTRDLMLPPGAILRCLPVLLRLLC